MRAMATNLIAPPTTIMNDLPAKGRQSWYETNTNPLKFNVILIFRKGIKFYVHYKTLFNENLSALFLVAKLLKKNVTYNEIPNL